MNEETLDPADWDELRSIGHSMLDDMFEFLQTVRERPVWQPVPDAARQELSEQLPRAGMPIADVYEQFKRAILPFPTGNIHPRFWGWVMGTGTPVAMLADLLASGMNAHVSGYDQSAVLVERQVLEWTAELLGFPLSASGVLTSSGTVANLIGLTVARHVAGGAEIKTAGVARARRLMFYCSAETHSWVRKAVQLLGLGDESLRIVPVRPDFTMDTDALQSLIHSDRAAELQPACVIGTAGTVNTGATDELRMLAAICRLEKIWFHVDGAFGAFAKLSSHAALVDGLELADSVAVDFHKWMYMPFEAGCAVVRDQAAHRATFESTPTYLAPLARGIAPEPLVMAGRGLDLSRGFKALKVWFSLKVHGADVFGRLIDQNIAQARHLASLIENSEMLELLAPVPLNVVCFRYVNRSHSLERLDAINRELVLRVQESGIAVTSSTMLHDQFAIRVAITNHRSRFEDFDLLVRHICAIAGEIDG